MLYLQTTKTHSVTAIPSYKKSSVFVRSLKLNMARSWLQKWARVFLYLWRFRFSRFSKYRRPPRYYKLFRFCHSKVFVCIRTPLIGITAILSTNTYSYIEQYLNFKTKKPIQEAKINLIKLPPWGRSTWAHWWEGRRTYSGTAGGPEAPIGAGSHPPPQQSKTGLKYTDIKKVKT